MPSGLPALLSFSSSFGSLVRIRLAVAGVGELRSAGGADHLLGRNAVDLLGVHAHEVLAAAGHDVGLVGVVAEVAKHFEHRLIGQLGVEPVPARMPGRLEPLLRFGVELLHRHAAQRRGEDLLEVLHREPGDRLPVARQHGLERLSFFSSGFFATTSGTRSRQ